MLQVDVPNSVEPLDMEIERSRNGIRELYTLSSRNHYDKLPEVVFLKGVKFSKKFFNGFFAVYTDK